MTDTTLSKSRWYTEHLSTHIDITPCTCKTKYQYQKN